MRCSAISVLPRTSASNMAPSSTSSWASSMTSAVAERTRLLMIASSPKNSPCGSTASSWGTPRTLRVRRTRPDWMTYISSPGPPSSNRIVPAGKRLAKRMSGSFSCMALAKLLDRRRDVDRLGDGVGDGGGDELDGQPPPEDVPVAAPSEAVALLDVPGVDGVRRAGAPEEGRVGRDQAAPQIGADALALGL